jgi:hypothetical protein
MLGVTTMATNVRPFPVKQGRPLFDPGPALKQIQRVAMAIETEKANRRDPKSTAPTFERLRHSTVEQYTATDEAGEVGHRVIDAFLLDQLFEGGMFLAADEDPQAARVRHSAGMWLRTLHHDSGLMSNLVGRAEATDGGDPERSRLFERSGHASDALALYQAIMIAMEQRIIDGDIKARVTPRIRRRHCHAVREISIWDRWPTAFTAREVRDAFDRLAAMEGVEVQG